VIAALKQFYGLQPTPPVDLFQFFVWEVLSEHALPARRDLAWQALRRLPALTPDAVFRTPAKDLLDAVGTAGPNREDKVERIRALVGEFKRHRDALRADTLSRAGIVSVGRALRRLEQVPSPARARAMLFSVGRTVLPVDEEVNRVISRLMGAPENRRRPLSRRWLAARLSRDLTTYREAVIYLRHHAQHTCLRIAPHCNVCPLRETCGSVQRGDPPA
jgi:endonuclease III